MVTIVIVTVLSATVGTFVIKLLTLQEQEREEAYIREKLADICGAYADAISIGSAFSTRFTSSSSPETIVEYRMETGGVSLETGKVSRVVRLSSSLNLTNKVIDVDVYSAKRGGMNRTLTRSMRGDAHLLPLLGEMVSCTITPLNANVIEDEGSQTSDSALGCLQVKARYEVENEDGELEERFATAERVVRLWNRE